METPPEPDEFDDVNESVAREWEAETTPYERVREVVRHVYTPQSAESIADDARTSPKTARKHLTALANEGFVATEPGETGGTHFRRSPESLVVEQAADILDRVGTDELVDRITDMRQELTELQAEYGVESLEALTVDGANRALSGTDGPPEIDDQTLQRWRTTRRNLAFANAALSVATAEQFVDGGSDAPGGTTVTQ